jgi:hypothetical protein
VGTRSAEHATYARFHPIAPSTSNNANSAFTTITTFATFDRMSSAPAKGREAVSALGAPDRLRHFVRTGAEVWTDASGYPMGQLAICGERTMAANDRYLAELPWCPLCKARKGGYRINA